VVPLPRSRWWTAHSARLLLGRLLRPVDRMRDAAGSVHLRGDGGPQGVNVEAVRPVVIGDGAEAVQISLAHAVAEQSMRAVPERVVDLCGCGAREVRLHEHDRRCGIRPRSEHAVGLGREGGGVERSDGPHVQHRDVQVVDGRTHRSSSGPTASTTASRPRRTTARPPVDGAAVCALSRR